MIMQIPVSQAQKPVTDRLRLLMDVGDSKGQNNRLRVVHRVIRLEINSNSKRQAIRYQYICNSLLLNQTYSYTN